MAAYDSFLPIQMNLRGRVAFEQNGRKAYVVSDGKGGVRYVSATKHHYQETGDIVPKYTRAYEEHLRKTGHEDQLESSKHADLVRERRASQQRSKQIKEALTHQQLKKDIKNEP
jgi:hypothetical protein